MIQLKKAWTSYCYEKQNFANCKFIPKKVNCGVFLEWNVDKIHKIG